MEFYQYIFMKCVSIHSVDITRSQMALDIPLQKINIGQKSLFFLGPKILSKIGPSIKNVRTLSSFMHAIKKYILLHLQNQFKLLPSSYDRYYHLILSQQHYFFLSTLISFLVVRHILIFKFSS